MIRICQLKAAGMLLLASTCSGALADGVPPVRNNRSNAVGHSRGFPLALYGGSFLTGNYGNHPQGFTARNTDGRPVYFYTKPSYYRFTIDGEHPQSQWHRWYDLR